MKDIEKIRPVSGYPKLTGKLIKVLSEYPPDFETADELIGLGADINAEAEDPEYNVLSEIIEDTGDYYFKLVNCKPFDKCGEIACSRCEQFESWNDAVLNGSSAALSVIDYCLKKGFDVSRKLGIYGAQCLWELTLAMPSKHLIDATRLLFDAGARNLGVDPMDEESSTAWVFIGTEGSYQFTCWGDDHLGNIYEAAWQMYYNREHGRPYDGIRSYEEAKGKKIIAVLVDKPESGEAVFSRGGPKGKQQGNCYHNSLYFILDEGVLVVTEYAEFWMDSNAPYTDTVDISSRFRRILGTQIKSISFDAGNTTKTSNWCKRPVAKLITSNGNTIKFGIVSNELSVEDQVAYYSIVR